MAEVELPGGGDALRGARGGFFPTTHWTQIAAIHAVDQPQADEALESLCRAYLPAIERYLSCFRTLPGDPHELANEFMVQFIHQDGLRRVDRAKGRFRNYLLGACRNFLRSRWRIEGRGPAEVEFDEALVQAEGAEGTGAVAEFDRQFAAILVGRAMAATKERFAGSQVATLIPTLLPYLGADPPEETLRQLAGRLSVSEALVYQNLRRIRVELSARLRAEVARHLGPEDDVADELQALLRAYAQV